MKKVELSALLTIIGIILLFSSAIVITLIAPTFVDPTWVSPVSDYQVQMYEVADPNTYLSSLHHQSAVLQAVYHIRSPEALLAFRESKAIRFVAPPELESYITRTGEKPLKLTSKLLLLRNPEVSADFDAPAAALRLREENPGSYTIYELFAPPGEEGFALASADSIEEPWADRDYRLIDGPQTPYQEGKGVIYKENPLEYRIKKITIDGQEIWQYDPEGRAVSSLEELISHPLGFSSRKELIEMGEKIFAIEGCWYCHTDQTRTLVQDTVLNGSASYPAPPSAPGEYIYQRITFPGTRRIGPDLSRVAIKRPTRDWHHSHFWSPKTESKGSIMPSFKHFFDKDPSGTSLLPYGVPNRQFEAVFQYLMTKGSRITPPNEAWWRGEDPLQTKEIIEGKKEVVR